MSQEGRSSNGPNIVIFGQTGSGKSSLINMLAGKEIAKVSSDSNGCTSIAKSYDIDIPNKNKKYSIWDTCGLNEGENGTVPAVKAADDLINLLKGMTVNLIIYFVRGNRIKSEINANINLFGRIDHACGAKVPIVLVVTELEQEVVMDDWWTRHEKLVKGFKIPFKGHACVTTIKGMKNEYANEYQESTNKVWKLVETHCIFNSSHNIIIFGEAGCGKSSIVNMIVGQTVAEVSNGPGGGAQCTFQHKRFAATIDDTHFNIYDTVGLNEGENGRVPHWKAIHQLYSLIRTLDGVSLLVYCIRGRIKENTRENWTLFSKVLCAKKVPIIAVETGLEHERDLDGRRTLLKTALERYGMVPGGIACIVSVRGKRKEYEDRYNSSQYQLRQLITRSYRREPWSMTTDDWISHIYQTTIATKLCVFPDVRVEFARKAGNVVDEFIEETGMKEDELDKLKSTLLHAEKEIRKASRQER